MRWLNYFSNCTYLFISIFFLSNGDLRKRKYLESRLEFISQYKSTKIKWIPRLSRVSSFDCETNQITFEFDAIFGKMPQNVEEDAERRDSLVKTGGVKGETLKKFSMNTTFRMLKKRKLIIIILVKNIICKNAAKGADFKTVQWFSNHCTHSAVIGKSLHCF